MKYLVILTIQYTRPSPPGMVDVGPRPNIMTTSHEVYESYAGETRAEVYTQQYQSLCDKVMIDPKRASAVFFSMEPNELPWESNDA